jgi:hypothetical protein
LIVNTIHGENITAMPRLNVSGYSVLLEDLNLKYHLLLPSNIIELQELFLYYIEKNLEEFVMITLTMKKHM